MSLETRIRNRLDEALAPLHVQLVNESHNHAVAPGSETHWNLIIVSPKFEGKRLVQRHRAVYGALGDELRGGIHALTMKTLAPDEWAGDGVSNPSPPCMGGSKADG
jgi:BolA family transcriptional regulator, general stress-responsive regulator